MPRLHSGFFALALSVLLCACGASTSTPVPTSTPAPTSALQPTATASTSLDPCQLISREEASSLAGASFGAGKESITSGGGKLCTYETGSANVFFVEVGQAADTAAADAFQADFLATLQENLAQVTSLGLVPTSVPNIGDAAFFVQVTLEGGALNGSAMGVRKGTIFFGFSDLVLGGPAPSRAAMETQAQTVLAKLP